MSIEDSYGWGSSPVSFIKWRGNGLRTVNNFLKLISLSNGRTGMRTLIFREPLALSAFGRALLSFILYQLRCH